MKPERIQLGLRSLTGWQLATRDGRAEAISRTYSFEEFWRALRFLRQASAMAQHQELRFDFELRGDALTLHLPAGEAQLELARGIESLASDGAGSGTKS